MSASGFRSLPFSQWPGPDVEEWRNSLKPFDPLVRSSRGCEAAQRWGTTTLHDIERGYGFWLGWLHRGHPDALKLTGEQRATRDRVVAYRDAMVEAGLADNTRAGRLQSLGNGLQLVAPAGDWSWILRASACLRATAKPVRDITSRMQCPVEIIKLGEDMMHEAEFGRFRTPVDRAILFRDGLLIAFLVQRPFRRANLSSITFNKNLLQVGDRWNLKFGTDETKTATAIEAPWPERHLSHLQRYKETFRPTLLACAAQPAHTDRLWISKLGTPMCAGGIEVAVKLRTEEHFGTAINPHTFRNIAATAIATFTPEEAALIMAILSHKTMRTSERYYNRARQLAAGEAYQATLAQLRARKRRA